MSFISEILLAFFTFLSIFEFLLRNDEKKYWESL